MADRRPVPGPPRGRGSFSTRAAAAAGLLAALPILGTVHALPRGSEETPPPFPLDPSLVRAADAIRDAFRSRRVDPLRALFPEGSRIFIAVRAIAPESSYYSTDQVIALMAQAFSAKETIQFHVNIDRPGPPGRGVLLAQCPAAWSFIARGKRSDVRLRFILALRAGRWTLDEVRETP